MSEKDAELSRLIMENAKLRAENEKLRENQMQHCRGCSVCVPHKCGAFWWCFKYQIAVDPDSDGCARIE